MVSAFFFILLGMLLLAFGGKILVKGAMGLALLLKLTPAVIGLTVVAMGTSAPEFFVSTIAHIQNLSSLTVGNLVGSNIINIALVIGLTALILPIDIEKQKIKVYGPALLGSHVLVVIFFLDRTISRWEGSTLLLLTVAITGFFIWWGKQHRDSSHFEGEEDIQALTHRLTSGKKRLEIARLFAYLLGGFFLLKAGSSIFLKGAVSLAELWGLTERVIGLTVAALGTSLPELATGITATLKGRSDVAIGNIIGSNIFNLIGILGFIGALKPVPVSTGVMQMDLPWLMGFSFFFILLMLKVKRLNRWEGGLFLGAYVLYTFFLLNV